MDEGIRYSKTLIQSLEKSLRNAFKQYNLELTKKPHNPGAAFRISLALGDKTVRSYSGQEHVLKIVLAEHGPSDFYFGFVAMFQYGAKADILESASLTVFHSAYTGETVPLFRAEWDKTSASDGSKHAQPHWHFVQRAEEITSIGQALSEEFDPEQKTELFDELVDCRGFHFALTSLWDKKNNESRPKQLFESDDFLKWFEQLTIYIAGQIEYMVSKMPSAAVKEFVPE